MTSLAVDIESVDAALATRYSGITISINGVPTAVEVFTETPGSEEVPEKTYPSVAIQLMDVQSKFSISESSDDEREEVAYDSGVTPHERSMRKNPLPHTLVYSVDTWHKDRVLESRELAKEVLIYRTDPRGYLSVLNIDGVSIDLWAISSGGYSCEPERLPDTVIYHNTLTLEVEVYLAMSAFDQVDSEKVAMEAWWTVFSRGTVLGLDGIEIESGGDVEDLTIRFTDTEEGPV